MKRIALIPLAVLMIGSLMACGSDEEEEKVVATVNDAEILESEWQTNVDQMKKQYEQYGMDLESEKGEQMVEQIEEQALESLIQQEVLVQKADSEDHEVTDGEVDEQYNATLEQYKNEGDSEEEAEETFEEVLDDNGFSKDSYRDLLEDQLLIEKYIDDAVSVGEVSDEEVEQAYEDYKTQAEEQDQEVKSLEDMEADLIQQVEQDKEQEAVQELINEAKEEYDIERNL